MDRREDKVSEKQVMKKLSFVRSVFKCFFVALLAVLLIVAIIFQAPWKVLTLLVVFLLTCTALPKPFRKWFWLSVGVIVIALVIWVFLPDDNEGWRPYTFDEELAALEAKYAIPDSKNAAMIYDQLLDSYDANAFEPKFMDWDIDYLTQREPWSSKDYPEIAEWLKGHENTIAGLLNASKIEKCQFPIVADPISSRELALILMPMRNWVQLLIRAANNDLGEGRIDKALEKHSAVLRLAEHLYQQPQMVSFLIGLAVEALAVQNLNRFIVTDGATEAHLNFIEETLRVIKHNWSTNYSLILEYEKLHTKNIWCMAYEVNPKGKIRLSRDPLAAWAVLWESSELMPKLTYWQKKLIKANTILSWFYMPSNPQQVGEVIDAGYGKLYVMAELDFDWQKTPRKSSFSSVYATPIKASYLIRFRNRNVINAIVNVSEYTYHKFHDQYLRVIAMQRGNLLLIALRHYKNKNGIWPQSLDDIKELTTAENLVDPINNSPFVYKLTNDTFELYSKGKNNIDDGGKRDKWGRPKTGADDWLIWPSRYYKNKEEKQR
jgi:hypothetical protein